MKLTTIAVTYGRKMNLGDYNSVHSEVTLWADLEAGDDEALATDGLRQMARHHVMSELARLEPRLQAKVEDIYMGLPVAVRETIEENGHAD